MAQATRQSSVVGELEVDIEIKSSAKKFHNMFSGRPQALQEASPDIIQRCDLPQGEFGKVGDVVLWNYVIDGQPKMAKEMIETVDYERNVLVLKVIDGDLMKEFKSFFITVQATPKKSGPGSVVKCHFKYEKIDEKVGHPENLFALFVKLSKDLDEMISSEA